MTAENQPQKTIIGDWHFRIKQPFQRNKPTKIMLLLHGYLGNENVMWVLTNPLPASYTFIAPRAPIKMGEDKYSWHKITSHWPSLEMYKDLAEEILSRVSLWLEETDLHCDRYDVMGFSQGAVMAYALAFLHPEKIGKVAALSGFIPQSWKTGVNTSSIIDKQFYIAHGIEDEIIPFQKATGAAAWLEENGACITLCKAKIGHKLSADCLKGLGNFFS